MEPRPEYGKEVPIIVYLIVALLVCGGLSYLGVWSLF